MGSLLFDPEALSGVGKSDCTRVLEKIDWLWENRTAVVHHPLRNQLGGTYKRVLGKYRIIYTYNSNADDMTILMVGTRDSIYLEAQKKYRS